MFLAAHVLARWAVSERTGVGGRRRSTSCSDATAAAGRTATHVRRRRAGGAVREPLPRRRVRRRGGGRPARRRGPRAAWRTDRRRRGRRRARRRGAGGARHRAGRASAATSCSLVGAQGGGAQGDGRRAADGPPGHPRSRRPGSRLRSVGAVPGRRGSATSTLQPELAATVAVLGDAPFEVGRQPLAVVSAGSGRSYEPGVEQVVERAAGRRCSASATKSAVVTAPCWCSDTQRRSSSKNAVVAEPAAQGVEREGAALVDAVVEHVARPGVAEHEVLRERRRAGAWWSRGELVGRRPAGRLRPEPLGVAGEALVQPDVAPRRRGDAVAEPLVGELVGDEPLAGCRRGGWCRRWPWPCASSGISSGSSA